MPTLGVNIDHVATLRQARYRSGPGASAGYGEPDAVHAAFEAQLGGAECITIHLREDRRHIIDRDAEILVRTVAVKLNLEMAGTEEMIGLARKLKPHQATIVPEGRLEVTTEGGLNVAGDPERWRRVVARLAEAGIRASAFIDPDATQITAAHAAGFAACELHTGRYAHAFAADGGDLLAKPTAAEFAAIADSGRRALDLGMRFNVGHALNYINVGPIAALPGLAELHIGHAIIARAVFVGLRQAVRDMRDAIQHAAAVDWRTA